MRATVFAAVVLAVSTVLAGSVGAQDALELKMRLDSGAEVDTNIHRVESIDGDTSDKVTAPLLRLGADADVTWRKRRLSADLSAELTGKLFLLEEGRSENVATARVEGQAGVALGDEGARVATRLGYYNAAGLRQSSEEENLGRNFATAFGELVATIPGPEGHRASVAFGYRDFVYKPKDDFNWRGEHIRFGLASLLWRGDPDVDEAASIELGLSYSVGRRKYQGIAFANACAPGAPIEPQCFMPIDVKRRDLNHAVAAQVSYIGERIYGARYELRVNDSNSFGQSLVRQRVELSVTSEIAATNIFATAKVSALFNHFLDPLILARDVDAQTFDSIDDENRNSLSLHVSKEASEKIRMEARYALFTNEFATQERTFRRQIFYLGLVFAL